MDSILKKMGITHTEAINLFYAQIEIHKGLPFLVSTESRLNLQNASLQEVERRYRDRIMNRETWAAVEEAKQPRRLKSYRGIKQILSAKD